MNSLMRGVGSGFGRVLGRFIGTIVIVIAIYFIFDGLGIDIKTLIPKIKGLIL